MGESIPWAGNADCPGMEVLELLAAFSWDRPVCEAWCGGVIMAEGAGPGPGVEEDTGWMLCPDTENAGRTGDAGADSWDSSRDVSIFKPWTKKRKHKENYKCYWVHFSLSKKLIYKMSFSFFHNKKEEISFFHFISF